MEPCRHATWTFRYLYVWFVWTVTSRERFCDGYERCPDSDFYDTPSANSVVATGWLIGCGSSCDEDATTGMNKVHIVKNANVKWSGYARWVDGSTGGGVGECFDPPDCNGVDSWYGDLRSIDEVTFIPSEGYWGSGVTYR